MASASAGSTQHPSAIRIHEIWRIARTGLDPLRTLGTSVMPGEHCSRARPNVRIRPRRTAPC